MTLCLVACPGMVARSEQERCKTDGRKAERKSLLVAYRLRLVMLRANLVGTPCRVCVIIIIAKLEVHSHFELRGLANGQQQKMKREAPAKPGKTMPVVTLTGEMHRQRDSVRVHQRDRLKGLMAKYEHLLEKRRKQREMVIPANSNVPPRERSRESK